MHAIFSLLLREYQVQVLKRIVNLGSNPERAEWRYFLFVVNYLNKEKRKRRQSCYYNDKVEPGEYILQLSIW
jgi:hypothetical protein